MISDPKAIVAALRAVVDGLRLDPVPEGGAWVCLGQTCIARLTGRQYRAVLEAIRVDPDADTAVIEVGRS